MKNEKSKDSENVSVDNKLMKESLLLPCTSIGKTTSASMAERTNIWAENKLFEKKTELDKKLHKSIIKLNVDKLEIVEELSRLKKSASTGSLRSLETALLRTTSGVSRNTHTPSTPTAANSISVDTQKKHRSMNTNTTVSKNSDSKTNIEIHINDESSVDEMCDDEKHLSNDIHCFHGKKKAFSVTTCQSGRECSSHRSELQTFENVSRRYARQLSPKPKSLK